MQDTYAPQLYVGFRKQKGETPLGFAVQSDNKKRIETVNGWRSKDIETRIIDNVPVEGFRFADKAERWTTNKEWFRMADPRGFMLEINVANALGLIEQCNIEKGLIKEKLVWLNNAGKLRLVREDNPEYLKLLEQLERKDAGIVEVLEVGKVYNIGHNEGITYLGRHFKNDLECDYVGSNPRHYSYYNNAKRIIRYFISSKKAHVFVSSAKWADDGVIFTYYSGNPKKFTISDKSSVAYDIPEQMGSKICPSKKASKVLLDPMPTILKKVFSSNVSSYKNHKISMYETETDICIVLSQNESRSYYVSNTTESRFDKASFDVTFADVAAAVVAHCEGRVAVFVNDVLTT